MIIKDSALDIHQRGSHKQQKPSEDADQYDGGRGQSLFFLLLALLLVLALLLAAIWDFFFAAV
jgi:flagellar biogenesis protein FliO